eukprot:TRINITY_DN2377_c0_g2_i1.p1 TRINITY_DN2377_c0_g2~~TRINITY_DN2377_c0_g2_i1.p1  ORF type:complete len:409 (+),score=71.66 TRINITY_DN2377_c0_g2_i1:60-1229(+)
MDFDFKPVEGNWWQVPSTMEELEIKVIADGAGREMVVSGGLLSGLGKLVKETDKTKYYTGLPVIGKDGGVGDVRRPTLVALTTCKTDAVSNAPVGKQIWILNEREDNLAGNIVKYNGERSHYRPVAGIHGPGEVFVATSLAQLSGIVSPNISFPSPKTKPPKKITRIGTCGDYPPLSIYDESTKEFTGLAVELLEAGFKGEIEWVKTTWPDLHKGLLEGRYEAAFGGINETEKRKEMFNVSEPVLPCGKCVLTIESNRERFQRFLDIDKKGVTVVTNPGGTNENFCNLNFKSASIRRAPDNKAPFTDLTGGAADVMITDSIEALHRQNTTPALCALHTQPPLTPGHTVVISTQLDFITSFNEFLNTPEAEAALEKLTVKWLGAPLARPL